MRQRVDLANVGVEAVGEAKIDDPKMGDTKKRGILLEAMSAMLVLMAGADVLVMRHPEAIKLVREMLTDLTAA